MRTTIYGRQDADQVFEIKVRANDISWEEAQSLGGAIAVAAVIAVREIARAKLGRDVEVTAPHVVHKAARTPRGRFRQAPIVDRLDEDEADVIEG